MTVFSTIAIILILGILESVFRGNLENSNGGFLIKYDELKTEGIRYI